MIGRSTVLTLGMLSAAAACGGKARNSEMYRTDTQSLLEQRNEQLKSCYDQALAADPKVAGTVTVQFVVAKKTGEVTKVTVDASSPPVLGQCVVQALQGLKLQPPDRHDGQATFEYAFQPPPAA